MRDNNAHLKTKKTAKMKFEKSIFAGANMI
jgi:hypothetical protein